MSEDTKPFVIVGDPHGTRLEIAAGSARAAAAAARYWHTEFGAVVLWGVRKHTPDPPMFMLGRRRHGLGPGHADGTVHAFPLTPGQFVPSEPAAYCGVRMPQEQMDLCEPCYGLPCTPCRTTVSQIYAARPGSTR